MAKTYTPIATQTLTANVSTIIFSSISSAYTDLILAASPVTTTSGNNYYLQFNSDAGSNYSDTGFRGSGTAVTSGRHSAASVAYIAFDSSTVLNSTVITASIQNYSNTTTYKTVLSRYSQSSATVNATVNLWRSTAAINSITIGSDGGTLALGGTFTLYGILKA
jgi:hypothetical protein